MILTEDEAKGKICDQKFLLESVPNFHNNYDRNCIGSSCMQWVEHNKVKKTGYCGRNVAHATSKGTINTGVR